MAVLSVPLRGAEVERVPLGFLFQGGRSIARGFSVAIATGIQGKQLLLAAFRDRNSAREFLPIQPCIQIGGAETPHFSCMGAVNLSTSCQLL
jgi:hypothetical protein